MKTNQELILEYLKDIREDIFRRKNGDKPKCSLTDLWQLVADVERRFKKEMDVSIKMIESLTIIDAQLQHMKLDIGYKGKKYTSLTQALIERSKDG